MMCDEHPNSGCMVCCPCQPTNGAHSNKILCNTHRAEVIAAAEASVSPDFWGALLPSPYLDRPPAMLPRVDGEQLPLW